jgi:hypothetical protein
MMQSSHRRDQSHRSADHSRSRSPAHADAGLAAPQPRPPPDAAGYAVLYVVVVVALLAVHSPIAAAAVDVAAQLAGVIP